MIYTVLLNFYLIISSLRNTSNISKEITDFIYLKLNFKFSKRICITALKLNIINLSIWIVRLFIYFLFFKMKLTIRLLLYTVIIANLQPFEYMLFNSQGKWIPLHLCFELLQAIKLKSDLSRAQTSIWKWYYVHLLNQSLEYCHFCLESFK